MRGKSFAAAAVLVVVVACSGNSPQNERTAGLWFAPGALVLPAGLDDRITQPLNADEARRLESLARSEVELAFSGLRVHATDEQRAFWRVHVAASLTPRGVRLLPRAGESLPLGPLGGVGSVAVDLIAYEAVHYAPPDASREHILRAIGRGIGRVAVHEFMHQILGSESRHNERDPSSYEFGSPSRADQYYGELHWTVAWPLLAAKLGIR